VWWSLIVQKSLQYQVQSRLGTGPIFSDRTGPAGLSFSTGPDRPLPAGLNS
jgi:hypothetical protein